MGLCSGLWVQLGRPETRVLPSCTVASASHMGLSWSLMYFPAPDQAWPQVGAQKVNEYTLTCLEVHVGFKVGHQKARAWSAFLLWQRRKLICPEGSDDLPVVMGICSQQQQPKRIIRSDWTGPLLAYETGQKAGWPGSWGRTQLLPGLRDSKGPGQAASGQA